MLEWLYSLVVYMVEIEIIDSHNCRTVVDYNGIRGMIEHYPNSIGKVGERIKVNYYNVTWY